MTGGELAASDASLDSKRMTPTHVFEGLACGIRCGARALVQIGIHLEGLIVDVFVQRLLTVPGEVRRQDTRRQWRPRIGTDRCMSCASSRSLRQSEQRFDSVFLEKGPA